MDKLGNHPMSKLQIRIITLVLGERITIIGTKKVGLYRGYIRIMKHEMESTI